MSSIASSSSWARPSPTSRPLSAKELGLPDSGVIGVSSGTDALLASLMALGVGPGDRVLTTPFSFFATAGAVSRLHARPEFVDIEPDSMNLDTSLLRDVDPSQYKAVIAVHLFGRTADIDGLRDWASTAELPIIEDAAQAIGARADDGRACGTLGDLGCFSFFPTKNLGAAGDGGCITSRDPELADRVRLLRTHGATRPYESTVIGGNFRLDAVQAAVLSVKLERLSAWTGARLENARLYDRLFREARLDDRLVLPDLGNGTNYIAHQYVIRTGRRDDLQAALGDCGVGCAVYYPKPFHLLEAFAELGYREGDFPQAEAAAREVLALPIFPELGEVRLRRVADAVIGFYRT